MTVFWLNKRRTVREAKSAVAMILLLKTIPKLFVCVCHHLPFACVKGNSKKIRKNSVSFFFRKMLTPAFLFEIQG